MGTKRNREPSNTLPLLAAVRSVLLTFALAAGDDHHRSMPTGRTAPIATPRSSSCGGWGRRLLIHARLLQRAPRYARSSRCSSSSLKPRQPFEVETLVARYQATEVVGPRRRFALALLDLIARLFGDDEANKHRPLLDKLAW